MRARTATAAACTAALLMAAATGALGQPGPGGEEIARGVVFEDLDRDGVRDPDEPGVADVSVSNGLDVVRTDAEGRYEVRLPRESILFVSKPAGYMVPVDEDNLPQFSYRHFPSGSPIDTHYPGIAPTGPLPQAINFPLHRVEESEAFDAVVFADPQARNAGELEAFRIDVVEELIGVDAAFGLTVGDIVNDPLDLFEPHNEIVGQIGIPWWNLPGNHDMNFDVPDDTYATQTYQRVYGPTDYSFDVGRVHFVNMDNVEYFGQERGGYRGYLKPEQLRWLAADLAHVPMDRLVVISTHIPLRTEAIGAANINTVNLDELFEVLRGRRVFAMSGHDTSNSWQMYLDPGEVRTPPTGVNLAVWDGPEPFHNQTLAEVRGGGWTTGPLDERGVQAADMADGNPNGYYVVSFDGDEYRTRFAPASLPEDFQIRLAMRGGEGNATLSDDSRVWIAGGPSGSRGIDPAPRFDVRELAGGEVPRPVLEANVFDGGRRHVVEVSYDGGPFRPMDYDPPLFGLTGGVPDLNLDIYIRTLRETLEGRERPVAPQPSSHIWTAELPPSLGPGSHVATVRSTDPHGQISQVSQTFVVTAGGPSTP